MSTDFRTTVLAGSVSSGLVLKLLYEPSGFSSAVHAGKSTAVVSAIVGSLRATVILYPDSPFGAASRTTATSTVSPTVGI
jgi:hypothetical protein